MVRNVSVRIPVVESLAIMLAMLPLVGVSISSGRPVVILTYVTLALLGMYQALSRGKASFRIYCQVFVASVVAVLVMYAIYSARYEGQPYYDGGSDDLFFELYAQEAARTLEWWQYPEMKARVLPESYTAGGYVYLLSLLVRVSEAIGGYHTLVPRLFNAYLLAMLSILVYETLIRDFGISRGVASRTALLLGLAPIMMYNAAHVFRDILVTVLLVWLYASWSGPPQSGGFRRLRHVVVSLAVLVLLWEVRRLSALAGLAIAWSAGTFARTRSGYQSSRIAVTLIVGIAMVGLVTVLDISPSWVSAEVSRLSATYTEYRLERGVGLSRYVFDAKGVLAPVLRLGYLLVSPVPVFSSHVERSWLSAGTLFQMIMVPFLVMGYVRLLRHRKCVGAVVAFTLTYAAVALLTFTDRHFVMYYPFAGMIVAYGYQTSRDQGYPVSLVVTGVASVSIVLVGLYNVLM